MESKNKIIEELEKKHPDHKIHLIDDNYEEIGTSNLEKYMSKIEEVYFYESLIYLMEFGGTYTEFKSPILTLSPDEPKGLENLRKRLKILPLSSLSFEENKIKINLSKIPKKQLQILIDVGKKKNTKNLDKILKMREKIQKQMVFNKIDKFYDLYKRAINDKFFFKKELDSNLSFEETKEKVIELFPYGKTLIERDYFIYADLYNCYNSLAQKNFEKNFAEIKDLSKIISSISRNYVRSVGKQMVKSTKIYVPLDRIEQFANIDISDDFLMSDLKIDQNYTIYFEDMPEYIFLIRKEVDPINNKSRYAINGVQPKDGMHYIFQKLYDIGDIITLNQQKEDVKKTCFNGENLLQKLNWNTPAAKNLVDLDIKMNILDNIMKTFLFMRAVETKEINRHPQANKIRSSNKDKKLKEKLLKSAPEFLVKSLEMSSTSMSSTSMSSTSMSSTSTGKNLRGHWVRGHFRKQRCGIKFQDTKIIFIEPFFKGDSENMVDKIFKL